VSLPTKRPKTGGRAPGTKNVATILRESRVAELEAALESNKIDIIGEIAGLRHDLDPKDRMHLLIALLPFRYPKLRSIEIKRDNPFEAMSHEELVRFSKELTKFLEESSK
jgi:hypothetical protein